MRYPGDAGGGSRQITGYHERSAEPGSGKPAGTMGKGAGDEGFTGKWALIARIERKQASISGAHPLMREKPVAKKQWMRVAAMEAGTDPLREPAKVTV